MHMMGSGCSLTSRGMNEALTLARVSQLRRSRLTYSYIPCHQYLVSTGDAVRLIPEWPELSCNFPTTSSLSAGRGTSLTLPFRGTRYSSPLLYLDVRTLLLILSHFDCDASSGMSRDSIHGWSVHMPGGPPCCAAGLGAPPLCTRVALAMTTTGVVHLCHA